MPRMSRKIDGFEDRLQKAAAHGNCPYKQQAIANRLGKDVDRRKVDAWMKGSVPRADIIYRIAKEFGVSARWLSTGEGAMVVEEKASDQKLTPEAVDIARAWMKLSPARQNAIREWVFLEAVVAKQYPWLLPGRPPGQSYDDYEKNVTNDLVRITKTMMMKGEK